MDHLVLRGEWDEAGLEAALGHPRWGWETAERGDPCPLANNGYLRTAGWGSASACCRIFIHADGICIRPGLDVEEDRQFCRDTFAQLQRAQGTA